MLRFEVLEKYDLIGDEFTSRENKLFNDTDFVDDEKTSSVKKRGSIRRRKSLGSTIAISMRASPSNNFLVEFKPKYKMKSLTLQNIDAASSPLTPSSVYSIEDEIEIQCTGNVRNSRNSTSTDHSMWSAMKGMFRDRVPDHKRGKNGFFSTNPDLERFYMERLLSRIASESRETGDIIDFSKRASVETDSFEIQKGKVKHSPNRKKKRSLSGRLGYFASFDFIYDVMNGKSAHDISREIELPTLTQPQLLTLYNAFTLGLDDSMMSILNPSVISLTNSDGDERDSFESGRRMSILERVSESNCVTTDGNFTQIEMRRINSHPIISNAAVVAPCFSLPTAELKAWSRAALAFIREQYMISWHPIGSIMFRVFVRYLRQKFPNTRSDTFFYESIRLLPFVSGYYLRAMLVTGFGSLYLTLCHLLMWPQVPLETSFQQGYMTVMYYLTLAQFLLNVCQFPSRVQLHHSCWSSSCATEAEEAVTILRTMVFSDDWLYNRTLNYVLLAIALFKVFSAEIYLWLSVSAGRSDPLREYVVSLSATDALTLWIKAFVTIIFCCSMSSPAVQRAARKRGLSKLDLDVLPVFSFSSAEQVENCDCSICLSSFTVGDKLISLPCDQNHSFHEGCIRQWLQRQNACPLCQKII